MSDICTHSSDICPAADILQSSGQWLIDVRYVYTLFGHCRPPGAAGRFAMAWSRRKVFNDSNVAAWGVLAVAKLVGRPASSPSTLSGGLETEAACRPS